ncbi:hypothetical protein QYF36_025454 [Acer negundo]|nr:hypothetical protein QYF36_025454 [Acer negundo]
MGKDAATGNVESEVVGIVKKTIIVGRDSGKKGLHQSECAVIDVHDKEGVGMSEVARKQWGPYCLGGTKKKFEEPVGFKDGSSSDAMRMDVGIMVGLGNQTIIETTGHDGGPSSSINLCTTVGPKSGKFKKWARDRVRMHNGL